MDVDGLTMEFGTYGKIRSFTLLWPDLEPVRRILTPTPQEIIGLIRKHRAMLLPEEGGTNYFAQLKSLAKASTLTITKITPYYGEGFLGETPENEAAPEFIAPLSELEATADLGDKSMTIRLLTPILTPETLRMIREGNR